MLPSNKSNYYFVKFKDFNVDIGRRLKFGNVIFTFNKVVIEKSWIFRTVNKIKRSQYPVIEIWFNTARKRNQSRKPVIWIIALALEVKIVIGSYKDDTDSDRCSYSAITQQSMQCTEGRGKYTFSTNICAFQRAYYCNYASTVPKIKLFFKKKSILFRTS